MRSFIPSESFILNIEFEMNLKPDHPGYTNIYKITKAGILSLWSIYDLINDSYILTWVYLWGILDSLFNTYLSLYTAWLLKALIKIGQLSVQTPKGIQQVW